METKLILAWLLPLFVSSMYVVFCPFTKVEESFNLQGIHDHIHHGLNIEQFDHNEFPGVVPRTFIGSLIVGYLVKPFNYALSNSPRIYMQLIARFVICSLVLAAYLHFLVSVKRIYGLSVSIWSCVLLSTQFHFLYYASRPLPNTFAAMFALLATSNWMRNRWAGFIFFSGWTVIVFRSELVIMFGLMLLLSLFYGRLHPARALYWIIITGVVSLGSTVVVDSWYWQRLVWPEGEAFYFNAILNKSSEWGTSPFFWYFYSALPRAMSLSLILAPLGMAVDRRCLMMSAPAFGFVLIYSLLPHKELRFILYVVPILNIPVARICSLLWINRHKGVSRRLAALMVAAHLFVNVCLAAFFLRVSYFNYPGGYALKYLNSAVSPAAKVHVHIDVYSAQTGVSRFLNEHDNWSYDKTEGEEMYANHKSDFTHLMVGVPDEHAAKALLSVYSHTHRVIHTQTCFKNIQIATGQYPFIDIRLGPCVLILERIVPDMPS